MALNAPVTAAFVAANAFVVGIVDTMATSKLFSVNSFTGATPTTAPTAATVGVPAAVAGFPQVSAAGPTLVAAGDGTNNEQVGFVKLTLVPNAADTVNASSPLQLVLSPNALVLTATTAAG